MQANFAGVRALIEKLPHRNVPNRITKIRRELCQWNKYKPPIRVSRMRNGEVGRSNLQLPVYQDVDINGTRPSGMVPYAAGLTFNGKALFEQLEGVHVRIDFGNSIQKPRLVGEIPGLGKIQ